MRSPAPTAGGSNVKSQWSLRQRSLWLGLAGLAVVSGVALAIWAVGLPPSWTMDYDRTRYARIIKAIAADPQHLCGRRLDDASEELGVEDVPWDDGNVQNVPGSVRIYHFRGFRVYVTLDYTREGVTQDMLLERGSPEEQLRARDLLRIHPHHPPFVLIDGLRGREERMQQYWAQVDEEIEEINREIESKLQKRQAGQD